MLETNTPPRTEGRVAKAIERRTSRLPSDLFLWAAVGALGTSIVLQSMNRRDRSLFFGNGRRRC
jgi:hypothetical protein